MPDPLAFKKDPEGDRWAGEDADEDDIKESWEEEEPTPVFLYMAFFQAEFIHDHWKLFVHIHFSC